MAGQPSVFVFIAGAVPVQRDRVDIFINGGSRHFDSLRELLPKMQPHGRVHLASIFLTDEEIAELEPHCDFVHRPQHAPGWDYRTHILYCTREINTLAAGEWFVKTDADTKLGDDWFEYVENGVEEHPDSVLFGVRRAPDKLDVSITGELVRRRLGFEIGIAGAERMCGAFYVGNTAFFKEHDDMHQDIHDLVWCHDAAGRRIRPSHRPDRCLPGDEKLGLRVVGPKGFFRLGFGGSEDTTRSILVHAAGAGDRMRFLSSGGRIGQELL